MYSFVIDTFGDLGGSWHTFPADRDDSGIFVFCTVFFVVIAGGGRLAARGSKG
jgi:hypothetical protein